MPACLVLDLDLCVNFFRPHSVKQFDSSSFLLLFASVRACVCVRVSVCVCVCVCVCHVGG